MASPDLTLPPALAAFNVFDWLVVTILAWSTVRAFLRGLLLEICSIVGLIAGVAIAGMYVTAVSAWLDRMLPAAFAISAPARHIAAFLLLALGVMILCGLLGRIIRRTVSAVGLGILDRMLGAAFGLARGTLITVVLILALAAFDPRLRLVSGSRLAPYFLAAAHAVSFVVPQGLHRQIATGVSLLKHNPGGWINQAR